MPRAAGGSRRRIDREIIQLQVFINFSGDEGPRPTRAFREEETDANGRTQEMKIELYDLMMSRRAMLKGAAALAAGAAVTASLRAAGGGAGSACRHSRHPRRRQGPADRCRLAEGRRDVPWAHQGQRQGRRVQGRRALVHGPQQPERPQRAVPRPVQGLGRLYRRHDQLDRPRAGRLQCRACSSRSPPALSIST